jgi:hypothetical protein
MERERGRESHCEKKLLTDVSDRKEVSCLICGCSNITPLQRIGLR